MSEGPVVREDHDGVARLTLRHGKANAIDVELLRALRAALADARAADAVVLTGTGSIFSAGVDLKRVLDGGEPYTRVFLAELSSALRELFLFPRPVVAAVNGHAIAGGCILALACDFALGADGDWRMGVPELLVGVPFPAVPLEIVRFRTPTARLHEAVYRGATLGPADAHDLGWIDALVPAGSLLEHAHERAHELARLPRASFELTKAGLRGPALRRMDECETENGERIDAAWTSDEVCAAVAAYVERVLRRK